MFIAHVRWFVSEHPISTTADLASGEIMAAIAAALVGVYITFRLTNIEASKLFLKWGDKKFKRLAYFVLPFTRYVLGLLLLLSAWMEYYFAPNIVVTDGFVQFLSWLTAGLGILLITGVFVRLSAILLGLIYLFSYTQIDALLLFEHVEFLALAVYLSICGGGKFSIKLFKNYDFDELGYFQSYALPVLRIGTGLSLATLALSEKLLNVSAAQEFLYKHDWNFLSVFGVNDRWFIIIVGIIELTIGIALILNIATRYLVILVLTLFIITASLLGVDEVIGHMFALAVVVAVWVNYPKPFKLKQLRKTFHNNYGK